MECIIKIIPMVGSIKFKVELFEGFFLKISKYASNDPAISSHILVCKK